MFRLWCKETKASFCFQWCITLYHAHHINRDCTHYTSKSYWFWCAMFSWWALLDLSYFELWGYWSCIDINTTTTWPTTRQQPRLKQEKYRSSNQEIMSTSNITATISADTIPRPTTTVTISISNTIVRLILWQSIPWHVHTRLTWTIPLKYDKTGMKFII